MSTVVDRIWGIVSRVGIVAILISTDPRLEGQGTHIVDIISQGVLADQEIKIHVAVVSRQEQDPTSDHLIFRIISLNFEFPVSDGPE